MRADWALFLHPDRLSQKAEAGANHPNCNDQFDEKTQSSLAICVHDEQQSSKDQCPELTDKKPRLRCVRTYSLSDVVNSGRAVVRPGYGLEEGEGD